MAENIHKLTIPEALAGQRLDRTLTTLLAEKEAGFSRARLQALLKAGHVTLIRKAVSDANRKVKNGEIYSVHVPPPEAAIPEAQNIPLTIVYEDKDLLVLDKPAGLVVHPAPGNRAGTLVNALLAHCKNNLSGIGGVARPGIVHRLDKDTSGLMVVAKNDAAHQALSRQFADRNFSRTYQALVWGEPTPRAGEIAAPLGRHPRDRKKRAVVARGKPALTFYKVLKVFGGQRTGAGRRTPNPCPLSPVPFLFSNAASPPAARTRSACISRISSIRWWAIQSTASRYRAPSLSPAKRCMRWACSSAIRARASFCAFASPLPPDMAALIKKIAGRR